MLLRSCEPTSYPIKAFSHYIPNRWHKMKSLSVQYVLLFVSDLFDTDSIHPQIQPDWINFF